MRRLFLPAALAAMPLSPALPDPAPALPPGLEAARLLPGWTDDEGNRIAALELELQPGWKTYWRSPGDGGLPPRFDWQGSDNLAAVTFHWPTPEAIDSGGMLSIGYHDRLILPFTAQAEDGGRPVALTAGVELGLCLNICVPADLTLTAPEPGPTPDPRILEAMGRMPEQAGAIPACTVEALPDGVQLRALLPPSAGKAVTAAIELDDRPEIWVSSARIVSDPAGDHAVADLIAPGAAAFDLPAERLRLTLIGPEGAVEMQGCDDFRG